MLRINAIWSKDTPNQQALAYGASMWGGLNGMAYLCQTTKRTNTYSATDIAIQPLLTTTNNLKSSSHELSIKLPFIFL
jgi:hypothetical protein